LIFLLFVDWLALFNYLIQCPVIKPYLNMDKPPYPPNTDNLDDVVKLIESGIDINTKYDQFEETLFHYASRHGHIDIVKYLISNGADVNATDQYLNTPLHDAARSGNIQIIKLLLDSGADKCAVKQTGHTAAGLAVCFNNSIIADYIDGYEYEPIPTKGVYLDG